MTVNYWIMKSEPNEFSIDDLEKKKIATWDGVRNYQVRNMMRDVMKIGDAALFYHSSCEDVGIVGCMTIASEAFPDQTALDKKSKYFDLKASKLKNPWVAIKVAFKAKFPQRIDRISLSKTHALADLLILKRGSRLSITPISAKEYREIIKLNVSM